MVMFHKGEPLELADVSIKMVMFHKGELALELVSIKMVMFHKGEPLELASFHKNGDVS